MKIYKKFERFILVFVLLLFSYSICSSHELPSSGYVSKRKAFCSIPFYIIIIFAVVLNFLYD